MLCVAMMYNINLRNDYCIQEGPELLQETYLKKNTKARTLVIFRNNGVN